MIMRLSSCIFTKSFQLIQTDFQQANYRTLLVCKRLKSVLNIRFVHTWNRTVFSVPNQHRIYGGGKPGHMRGSISQFCRDSKNARSGIRTHFGCSSVCRAYLERSHRDTRRCPSGFSKCLKRLWKRLAAALFQPFSFMSLINVLKKELLKETVLTPPNGY